MRLWQGAPALALASLLSAASAAAGTTPATTVEPRSPRTVTIEMTAKRFAFTPDVIEVTEGDQITLAVKSLDGTHGLEIKALKIKQKIPRSGETVQVSFTAPAPGEYEIKCSDYCGLGHGHMKATLVVKPRGQPEASAAR